MNRPDAPLRLAESSAGRMGATCPTCSRTLFEYGKIPVYLRLNLGCETPEIYRFQGSKGILEVTEFTITYYPQSGKDTAPSYYATASFPQPYRDAIRQAVARTKRSAARQRTTGRGLRLQGRFLGRPKAAPLDLFPGSAHAQACRGGCRVRTQRRACLPHVKHVVFQEEHGYVGRLVWTNQNLRGEVCFRQINKRGLELAPFFHSISALFCCFVTSLLLCFFTSLDETPHNRAHDTAGTFLLQP